MNLTITPEEMQKRQEQKIQQQQNVAKSEAEIGVMKQSILSNALGNKYANQQPGQMTNTAVTNGWGANTNA